jgi:hypothetical protein
MKYVTCVVAAAAISCFVSFRMINPAYAGLACNPDNATCFDVAENGKAKKIAPKGSNGGRITCQQWLAKCRPGGQCNDPNRLVNASCDVRGHA